MAERIEQGELILRLNEAEKAVPAGHYEHTKSEAIVVVYDWSLQEDTLLPRVHYVHDSVKFNRPIDEFKEKFKLQADLAAPRKR